MKTIEAFLEQVENVSILLNGVTIERGVLSNLYDHWVNTGDNYLPFYCEMRFATELGARGFDDIKVIGTIDRVEYSEQMRLLEVMVELDLVDNETAAEYKNFLYLLKARDL